MISNQDSGTTIADRLVVRDSQAVVNASVLAAVRARDGCQKRRCNNRAGSSGKRRRYSASKHYAKGRAANIIGRVPFESRESADSLFLLQYIDNAAASTSL